MARSFLCSYSRLMKLNFHEVKVFGGGGIRHHTLVLVGLKSHSRSFLSIDEIKIIMETNVPAHTSQFTISDRNFLGSKPLLMNGRLPQG